MLGSPSTNSSSRCATILHGIQDPQFPVLITTTALHDLSRHPLTTIELVLNKVDFCASTHFVFSSFLDSTSFRHHCVSNAFPLQTSLPARDFMRSPFILSPTAFYLRGNKPHSNRSWWSLPAALSLISVEGYQPLLIGLSRFSRSSLWSQPLRRSRPLVSPQPWQSRTRSRIKIPPFLHHARTMPLHGLLLPSSQLLITSPHLMTPHQ